MLIFEKNQINFVFIHIPKTGGVYMRRYIMNDPDTTLIKEYWGIDYVKRIDYAHIPFIKRFDYISHDIDFQYFTFCRNPYDRIISAYFYKTAFEKYDNDFKYFVKNYLVSFHFSEDFHHSIIHFYPQYRFLSDENNLIAENITITKIEENHHPRKYNLLLYFDEEVLEIINHIYENDFILFHYEKLTYPLLLSSFSDEK